MGVIRNNNFKRDDRRTDDHWIYISSEGEEPDHSGHDGETFSGYHHQHRSGGASRQQRAKKSNKPEPTFSALGVKGKSHKKSRRYANANLFHDFGSLVNETDLDEISIGDFIPSTPSSFSQLLDKIGGGDFNEFLECTEAEQTIMLESVIENQVIDTMLAQQQADTEDYQRCFSRIAPAIRRQLVKKRVPLGILASIEEKVIDHFRNDPRTTYKTNLACSYQRFLLHACCQYLNLYCRSINQANGKRLSCVHNQQLYFIEPSKLLSEYLGLAH